MKVVAAIFIAFFALCCYAENDIYIGGDFLLSMYADDDEHLDHAASIVAFNPDDNQYYNIFEGGVYRKSGFINTLVDTPLGTYGAGYFTNQGGSRSYCSAILRYDNDEDDFDTVGTGILLKNTQLVNFIAGTDDYTFFGGLFDSVEQISLGEDEQVFSPSLVKLDSEDNYSNLEDPDSIFPEYPTITGLVTYEETLFINAVDSLNHASGIYSWTEDNSYTVISSIGISGELCGDGAGNIAGTNFTSDGSPDPTSGTISLQIFMASTDYGMTSVNLYNVASGMCTDSTVSPPLVVGFNGGFLASYPNIEENGQCVGADFTLYTVSDGSIDTTNPGIPQTPGNIEMLVGTDDDDDSLWLVTNAHTELYYLPFGALQWIPVDLSSFDGFSIYTICWDDSKEKLLIYGSSSDGFLLLEAEPVSLPPRIKEKSPGNLYNRGSVSGLAVMNDPDDDDYELYIGGNFQSIGNGHDYQNFVVYKAGDYQSPLPNLPPLSSLAVGGTTVFYASTSQAPIGYPLPIGYYSKDSQNLDVWVDLPVMSDGLGYVYTMAANDDQIFVGGTFTVTLPNNAGDGHAVIYFDKVTSQWAAVDIPETITSGGTANGYSINSLSLFTYEGTNYVAIGGDFQFTVGDQDYYSFAVYNINEHSFFPAAIDFTVGSTVTSVVIDSVDKVYIGGNLQMANGGSKEGVFVYNFSAFNYTQVGNLPATAHSILLHHSDDDDVPTELYCGGEFKNGTLLTGLAFGPANSPPTQSFQRAGDESQFFQYYTGTMSSLLYTTGGNGANDENGYDPEYTPVLTSSQGMGGWAKFFLIISILLVIVFVVGGVAAGGFIAWKKKRANYQEV